MARINCNSDHIEWLQLQHNSSHHDAYKQMLKNVKQMSESVDQSNIVRLVRGVTITGWVFFSMFRRVFDCWNVDMNSYNLFANFLVERVPKFNETSECIIKLRDGTWYEHRREVFGNINNKTSNKSSKPKRVYHHLSQLRNLGNYDIKSSNDIDNDSKIDAGFDKKIDGFDKNIDDIGIDIELPPIQHPMHTKPFKEWTCDDVIYWIKLFVKLTKEQESIITVNGLTGEFLPRLDHPALSSVGITNIGDRITILDQIIKLCHNIPSALPGSLLVDQIHNIKSSLSPSKFVQTLSTPTIIPTATAKCSISTTSKASTSATPTPTPTYTTYKFGANKKKKEWWTSNTLYQDTKNRTKQLSKVFTKKWDKDASNIEAVPMGWIAIGIMGESSKQEIINFSKENFSKCKVGKMLGCLMPSRTGKTTTSSCNGYYFDINREEGKYAKKAAYAVIENNPYLKQIKAKYDKKQETNNDGTNNQEQSNDEHEKQEYQCNNDVDELINDKNEKQGINDNNKKRKLSISTALNGLEVQPLLKRRKIND